MAGRLPTLTARGRRFLAGGLRRSAERVLDLRYGVRTRDFVYFEDLGVDAPESWVWHDPSSWLAVRRALARLGVTHHDVFADLGSGLGRVVLAATTLPFRRVIGVEVSEELVERARANLERSRTRRRCGDIELVAADVTTWRVPADLTVAYVYSPFFGEPFERMVGNLLDSLDRDPRPLRLVYNYPVEHNVLIRSGRFRVLDVAASEWPAGAGEPTHVIVTYLALPADDALAHDYVARFPRRPDVPDEWLAEHEPGFVLEKPARLGGVVLDRRRPRDA